MSFGDILLGFAVSLLIGMGVGGGGIMTVRFTVFSDVAQAAAQGINLLTYCTAALAASPIHLRQKNIDRRKVAFTALCTCIGALIGALVAEKINADVLRSGFSVFLIVLGAYGLMKIKK